MSNEWISVNKKPNEDCEVLIASNYGVRSGYYSNSWPGEFQDGNSGNDEGMIGMEEFEFIPTHYMNLPSPPDTGEK